MATTYRFFHASATKNFKGIMENGLVRRISDSKFSKNTGEGATRYKAVYLYHINNMDIMSDMFTVYDEVDVYEVFITATSKLKQDEDSNTKSFFDSIEKIGCCAYQGNIPPTNIKYLGRFRSIGEYLGKINLIKKVEKIGYEDTSVHTPSDSTYESSLYDAYDVLSKKDTDLIDDILESIQGITKGLKRIIIDKISNISHNAEDIIIEKLNDKHIKAIISTLNRSVKELSIDIVTQQIDKFEMKVNREKISEIISSLLKSKIHSENKKLTPLIDIVQTAYNDTIKTTIKITLDNIKDKLGIESVYTVPTKDLEAVIKFNLNILKQLSPENHDRVKETLANMKSDDDRINFLINPIELYATPGNEPKGGVMQNIVEQERIILTEKAYLPFKAKIKNDDGTEEPIVSAKNLTIYHVYVRRNQQIADKENKAASSAAVSDVLGMSAGTSRVGTLSDPEWSCLIQHNSPSILKELCGPLSADAKAKRIYKSELMKQGQVSLADLPDNTGGNATIHMLDQMLKMMDIDSDLIAYPEEYK